MAYAVLATAVKSMGWPCWTVDASELTTLSSLPSDGTARDAVAPYPLLLQPMTVPIIEAILEARTLTAGIVLGFVIILAIRYSRSPWRKLPPSPKRLPVVGNALQLMDKTWLLSEDCKERFGELIDHLPTTMLRYVHENCRRGYVP